MNRLGLFIYRIFVVPAVVVMLPVLALFNGKIREGLRRRRQKQGSLPEGLDPVWIHAASGEFEYAKAVIREVKRVHPRVPIVVSYFSPTYAAAVEKFPGVALAVALPLDLRSPCRAFLRRLHPRILLIARTDLWPEMLEQCRQRKVPVVLFSYTLRGLRSRLRGAFTRWILNWVQQIYCVSETDRKNLNSINAQLPCEVLGDTRYDQVAYRLSQAKPLASALKPNLPCVVAGSTWPEDEDILLPALKDLLLNKQLKLILVPHEPTRAHVQSLERRLQSLGLSHALYSANAAWNDKPVLLVDQVGHLAELYACGTFAFIGGSFRRSVHSVMEALGAGLMTFVGPMHENNREALEFQAIQLGSYPGVQVAQNADDLRSKLELALKQSVTRQEFQDKLRGEFNKRQGASQKLVEHLSLLMRR